MPRTLLRGASFLLEGVMVDITKEKCAMEILRESESLYRSLFTETHAVMILLDPESGDIVDVNPAACSYYGYSREEMTQKKIFDFNTLPQEQVFNAIERAVSEKQRYFSFRHRLANGDIRDVEVYCNPIKIKGKSLLFAIINDITERKQAEKALRESEERFSKLSEATWEAIVIHERGRLVHANSQYYQMFGYEPAELFDKETIPMTATPESAKIIMEYINAGKSGPYEVTGLRKTVPNSQLKSAVK
jgi:PAS domain S-box-containing protein